MSTGNAIMRADIERAIAAGKLSPAARDMSPDDVLWQYTECNALTVKQAVAEIIARRPDDSERGSYGIFPVPPSTPGALVCGDNSCGRAWLDDITPSGRCPWEDLHTPRCECGNPLTDPENFPDRCEWCEEIEWLKDNQRFGHERVGRGPSNCTRCNLYFLDATDTYSDCEGHPDYTPRND